MTRTPLSVQFDRDCYFDAYELSLKFLARVDGRDITCLVSLDTLEDSFGCTWEDAEDSFFLFRARIESVARTLIEKGQVDQEGELRLRLTDFSATTEG